MMKKYSNDKNINTLVNQLLKYKGWSIKRGRHPILVTPMGRKLTVPSTPSDFRAYKNFKLDIRRLQGL
jgi:hypothetical protein